jgi:hypothetical protein
LTHSDEAVTDKKHIDVFITRPSYTQCECRGGYFFD